MSEKEVDTFDRETAGRPLPPFARWYVRIATVAILLLAINQAFNTRFFVDITLITLQFNYIIIALALSCGFLLMAPTRHLYDRPPGVLDWLLVAVLIATCAFFFANSYSISLLGWEVSPPFWAIIASFAMWVLVLEAGRRAGGLPLAIIVFVMSTYPLYTEYLPAAIAGFGSSAEYVAAYHAMGSESIIGIPLRTFASLIIGFIIFGAALQRTGAGQFFMDVSFGLLGHVRGGPAKVSIFSSGLMGSMSGSVITNVLTTGVLTIPAMRRVGMSGTFAAGVETCASTGGVLMPPVMGATAFVMASFMGVPYADVALAAAIPSILYFFGLFAQIDARAGREGLEGLPSEELPSVRQALKEGWYYVFAFALLIFMLLVMRREALAPYFATPLLILLNQIFSKKHRWKWRDVLLFIDTLGSLFANLVAILAAVGMIMGALAMTGVAATLVNDLLRIAGGDPLPLLIMGALTGLLLGVGMTSTAAYIFLAILLAPALIKVGLEPMAVHLFIFYWGMLSFITPPVALGAFAAASIAKTKPMRTGVEAMKLGSVIYFIPFFFVFEPALVMAGPWNEAVVAFVLAVLGIGLYAGAIQGYIPLVGHLFPKQWYGLPLRLLMIFAAILVALPSDAVPNWSDLELLGVAAVIALPLLAFAAISNKGKLGGAAWSK